MGGRDPLHPVERLDPALRLAGFRGFRPEAADVVLEVGDFALLAFVHRLLLRELGRALLFESAVVA